MVAAVSFSFGNRRSSIDGHSIVSTIMTMTTTAPPATLGQHLDHAIESFHSLSSTQLYTLIVGLIVLVTYYLLGSAPLPLPLQTADDKKERRRKMTTSATTRNSLGGPEPRWHYFQYVSLAVVALFLASGVEFGLHARAYMRDSGRLLQFLVGWSVCLLYFFGFFGVSFVYNSEYQDEEQEEEQTEPAAKNYGEDSSQTSRDQRAAVE